MEFRVLNYFLTVAREKTISKAAEVLHVSQPTLSKQLKDLEEELGTQLFIRGNREITLTEDGYYLLNRGKEIQALVESTTSNLAQNEVISGELWIGGGETEAIRLIATILRDMREQYPDISIHLFSGNADNVLEKLDNGLMDFALVIDPVEKQKYEYVRLPFVDQFGILVNRSNPLSQKNFVVAEDLKAIPLFIPNQSQADNQLAEWLGGNIENYNVIGTYNLLYNASLMVDEDLGSVLCLDGIINTTDTNLKFLPFHPPLTANVNVVWKKNQVFSNAAKAFLNVLLER